MPRRKLPNPPQVPQPHTTQVPQGPQLVFEPIPGTDPLSPEIYIRALIKISQVYPHTTIKMTIKEGDIEAIYAHTPNDRSAPDPATFRGLIQGYLLASAPTPREEY